VYGDDEDFGSLPALNTVDVNTELPSAKVDPAKLNHLSAEQKQEFLDVLDDFADAFVDKPGLCKTGMHNNTADFKPKCLKAYRIPELLKPEVARQIQELLDLGFIQPSDSEMASPIVCVLKGGYGENGVRLYCDYRYVNKFTKSDSFQHLT